MWGLSLLAVQISAIYLWGTYAKLTTAYLSGERFEHYTMYLYLGSDYPDWPGFHALMLVLAWSAVVIEPVLAIGLFFKRARPYLIPAGLLFHAILYWTLPVGVFSVTMFLCYLAYLDPDAFHRWLDRLMVPLADESHPLGGEDG